MDDLFALDNFLENEESLFSLKNSLKESRLSHAVLLCALDGCGRGYAARLLAADFLFSPFKQNNRDISKTKSQIKAVIKNESPEVIILTGQGASGQIPVESVRKARQDIFQSGLSSEGRVVLIPHAYKMTQGAANALLKVLEEPPAHALFILCAPSPTSVPVTIASRCADYRLAPLSYKTCLNALENYAVANNINVDNNKLTMLCYLYGGRLGLCIKALQNDKIFKIINDACILGASCIKKDPYTMLKIFSEYEEKGEEGRQQRELLLQNFQNLLSSALLGNINPPLPQISSSLAAELIPLVGNAISSLKQNSSPKITFTALVVKLLF